MLKILKINQLQKGVFLHPIVQAVCFNKPVESFNYCQIIVRQKRLIFVQALSRQFKKKN
jgi:hypothetical protein